MKYLIKSDLKGRLRVRLGKYAFTPEQERGIVAYFQEKSYVNQVEASHVTGSILIYYPEGSRRAVLDGLTQTPLSAIEVPAEIQEQKAELDLSFKRGVATLIVKKIAASYLIPSPISKLLCIRAGWRFIKEGLRYLLKGQIKVEVLDGAAVGVSLLQGKFDTAASIMFFLRLSELLESYTRQKTRNALTESLVIHVDRVWIEADGEQVQIPMAQLKVGDQAIIKTGALIPVDGTITSGQALINESAMTGEPLSVFKKEGDSVFAGTVIEEGSVRVEVRALQSETRIRQIVDLIDQSEELKAGIQGQAERIADRIVPFSFLLSAGVFAFTRDWRKAVSVLLIDYSCAIKMATPIAVISGMQEAADHKIMVKGGKHIEAVAQADTVVFDKTGTLTVASPVVSKVVPFAGFERDEVLKISACLEEHFPHSVARAVVKQAEQEGILHEEMHTEVEYVVAHGIATTINGQRAIVGSQHFVFEDEQVEWTEAHRELVDREAEGSSIIYLAVDQKAAGFICVSDPPRQEAAEAISGLKKLGIREVIMMTGDSRNTAERVSEELGIDRCYAQVLPADKAEIIEQLKAEGRKVLMVGDGVNDSPALAAANVSVAMKDSSDIAREVADVTLLTSDLTELIVLRRLSEQVMRRIKTNFGFIMVFNTMLLGLGTAGLVTADASAFWHNASTLGVSVGSTRKYLKEE